MQTKENMKLPAGSADYSKMLALATSYKKGALTFEKLTQLIVAEKLPPHPIGCGKPIGGYPLRHVVVHKSSAS